MEYQSGHLETNSIFLFSARNNDMTFTVKKVYVYIYVGSYLYIF